MKEKNKEKWISLKEAAKMSGYSADYLGQLIRKGKLPGKQVYYNIAWLTNSEAVLKYKQRENKKGENKNNFKTKLQELKQKIIQETGLLKLFFKTFKYVLPIIIVLILSFSMLLFYLFFIFFSKEETNLINEADFQIIQETSRELEY